MSPPREAGAHEGWHRLLDTSLASPDDICDGLDEASLVPDGTYLVQPRSVVILIARRTHVAEHGSLPLPSERFKLIGIKKLLLTPAKRFDLTRTEGPMRVLFGLLPTSAKDTGHDLADYLKSVQLFEGVGAGDLRRLAQLVHERSYRDGEYMFEQGKPSPPCLSSAPAPSSS